MRPGWIVTQTSPSQHPIAASAERHGDGVRMRFDADISFLDATWHWRAWLYIIDPPRSGCDNPQERRLLIANGHDESTLDDAAFQAEQAADRFITQVGSLR